jgi:hypothetical protein
MLRYNIKRKKSNLKKKNKKPIQEKKNHEVSLLTNLVLKIKI